MKAMENTTVFEVSRGRVNGMRRTSVGVAVFVLLDVSALALMGLFTDNSINLAGRLALFILFAFIICLFLFLGLKQNGFAITTTGIYPPSKPWRKILAGRYFIPYSEIQSMELVYLPYWDSGSKKQDTHPHAAVLHLKDGRSVPVNVIGGMAPLYFYVDSEKTMRGVYQMLEVVKREIDEQRSQGVEQIVIAVEKLEAVPMGKVKRRKLTLRQKVILAPSLIMGVAILVLGIAMMEKIFLFVGSMLVALFVLLGYPDRD